MTGPRKRLGEILVDAGVLDAHQLQAALGHQRQWGGKLGRILVEKRFITEEIMLRAVSRQLGLDMVDLSQQKIHERVIGLLTPEIVTKFNVIPVGLKREGSTEVMYLAMSDPTNVEATDTVSFKTGKKVRPLLASEASIERAIRLYYLGETAIPNVQPVVEAQFGGHEVELTEDLPVLTGTAAVQPVALAPPPRPVMATAAPFAPAAAPPGGDWFFGDANPPAPTPQPPPRAAAPGPPAMSPSAPFGPANGMLGEVEQTPPPVAARSANPSGVWATPGPPVTTAPTYTPPAPAQAEPVHTPAYGVPLSAAPVWNPPPPLAPPPPAPPPPPAVVTTAGFPLPGPGFPFPPAPPPSPPPAAPAPAVAAAPPPPAAEDWGAAVDDPNPPQALPLPAAAPRAMEAVELPPDDGAPMELADAHEFLDAAQANHGGNTWVKTVPSTRGTTGEIEFDEGAAMDLELAFEPMDMVAPAQPEPLAAQPPPPAAGAFSTPQPPVEPAWGASVAWSAPAEPTPAPPDAMPAVAAAPLPEVQAGLPSAEPSWGDALGGLPAPPHTPHAWAAPAQQAAASSGWLDAAPAVDAPPVAPNITSAATEPTALEPPALEPTASAPPAVEPPAAEPTGPEPTGPEPTGPEPTEPHWQVPAESPTPPPAPAFSLEEQAALDIPPAPAPPSAPHDAAALDVGAAPEVPTASGALLALPAEHSAAPLPDADGRVDLLGAPRMLTNEFAILSQSLDPSLERSGRFPAVSLADQSSPPAPLPASVMEAAAASAAMNPEMPAWDLALGLPDPPAPPATPAAQPVGAGPVPQVAEGGFLFGAGEVVTDPVALRLEAEGGNVALGMPTTLPGAETPAAVSAGAWAILVEQAWGAPAESTIATDPGADEAAVTPQQTVDADAAWGALTQGEDVAAVPAPPPATVDTDASLAWEAADLLEGLPPPQGDAVPPVETPQPPTQPAVSVLPPLEPAAAAPMAPAPPAPAEDALANTNLEAASVVSLARLFIKKGLLSEDEVKEALSKPPSRVTRAEPALEARGLCVEHAPPHGPVVPLLQRVDLALFPGQLHALVGESGSGKTLAALALMDLVPPGLRVSGGEVFLHGKPRPASAAHWRGSQVGMVFQDPLSALHPLLPVGEQLVDVLVTHHAISRAKARQRAQELLSSVGIAQPQARARLLPHALSGGMRQRVMLALALCGGPRVLLADEPTTALDPLVASGVLALLDAQVSQLQLAVLLITHDLVLAAQHAGTVAVMHAGSVVEQGPQRAVLGDAAHPYTRSLVRSRPHALTAAVDPGLAQLADAPPIRPGAWPPGCRYAPRCAHATAECRDTVPTLTPLESGGSHLVACFHPQRGGLP